MSKNVLIVEKDTGLMGELRDALAARGFAVEETTDGKGAPEIVRRSRPDCVVLAVDLDAGQNGYLVCKKLKSDDDLKAVPVIIIGDPKGFGPHQKLKTRAEDYVGKPLDAGELVDHVGNLVGFPTPAPAAEPAPEEQGFDPASLLDEDATGAEEIPLNTEAGDEPAPADADFEMVDNVFGDEPKPESPPPPVMEDAFALDTGSLLEDEDDSSAKTVVGFMPLQKPAEGKPEARPGPATVTKLNPPHEDRRHGDDRRAPGASGIYGAEDRELRSKVAQLTSEVEESKARAAELEAKLRETEAALETSSTELEAARTSTGGKSDKEVFSLKDAVNKKDKEILKLKSELNDKEKEIVELREKENSLDQRVSEGSGDLAKRDAQIKTLQAKADQLGAERKKTEQQLLAAKDEARTATANLSTLQSEFEGIQARIGELEAEVDPLRSARSELETEKERLETEASELRGEVDALKSQLDERNREADEVRSQYEQAQLDLDSARTQLTTQATSFAEEMQGMRQKQTELEDEAHKHEERLRKQQQALRGHQEAADRAREALQTALSHLERQPGEEEEIDLDELAEA